MTRKLLIVNSREEVMDSMAELLRSFGYDVTGTTGSLPKDNYDSVLYVAEDLNTMERRNLTNTRTAYPKAKIVVYTSAFGLDLMKNEIKQTGAETLEWIRTPEEIAAALR